MIRGAATTDEPQQALPPVREIAHGLVIGLVIGIVLWVLILQLFGGVNHHFSFGP
jgi:Mg/Co/Ni transporter MgtE